MTVLFQDKIIYMSYMPPFARSEDLNDYIKDCLPVKWSQTSIHSLDRTRLSLCVGQLETEQNGIDEKMQTQMQTQTQTQAQPQPQPSQRRVVICYFQGNGSSLPPRLPLLSNALKAIAATKPAGDANPKVTLVALSYRGYWTSSGRASEAGIRNDAQAMLAWIADRYGHDVEIILWGQSIGAGVACAAAAAVQTHLPGLKIAGLVLETPFTSIKSMLIALYPQKWLPYQYLWPFLWNHWDNELALREISRQRLRPRVLLLTARRDEVVPPAEADKIETLLHELEFDAERVDIFGSLHTEATTRREGQQAVANFVVDIITNDKAANQSIENKKKQGGLSRSERKNIRMANCPK